MFDWLSLGGCYGEMICIVIYFMVGENVFLKLMFGCCWNFWVIEWVFSFLDFLLVVIFVLNIYFVEMGNLFVGSGMSC